MEIKLKQGERKDATKQGGIPSRLINKSVLKPEKAELELTSTVTQGTQGLSCSTKSVFSQAPQPKGIQCTLFINQVIIIGL